MSEPYLGEIKIVPYNFTPKDWAFCAGQIAAISENQALFALLGTTYGGDGRTSYGLPDLRGRVPVGSSIMENRARPESYSIRTKRWNACY